MKRYLPFIIVAAVALLALGSGALLYRAKRLPVPTAAQNPTVSGLDSAESIHVRGDPKAAVTLEEFGDFQCPPCAALSVVIHQLEKDYHGRLRVIFRHFPLANHQHARAAAAAAEAANLQGRFWEMHDLLYREQPVWAKATDVMTTFNGYAGILGLNIDRFKKDMESEKTKARVSADHEHGVARGVKNTPTIFVNNSVIAPTALNPAGLRAAIDAALSPPPSPK